MDFCIFTCPSLPHGSHPAISCHEAYAAGRMGCWQCSPSSSGALALCMAPIPTVGVNSEVYRMIRKVWVGFFFLHGTDRALSCHFTQRSLWSPDLSCFLHPSSCTWSQRPTTSTSLPSLGFIPPESMQPQWKPPPSLIWFTAPGLYAASQPGASSSLCSTLISHWPSKSLV